MPGLYDPAYEHDGCGVALVARLDGVGTHEVVARGLSALARLEHRGAEGADADTGDGAGITIQLPDRLLREEAGGDLPPPGRYGVATVFLPADPSERVEHERLLTDAVRRHGQHVIGWRDVPVHPEHAGPVARAAAPVVRQLLVEADRSVRDVDAFERALYVVRRSAERRSGETLVVPSFSARTVVYKGMLSPSQLPHYYADLVDGRTESALALVHARFSTNTFPSWELAHPYRLIAHNGEVNTLTGNVNWMRARESQLSGGLLGDDLVHVLPAIRPHGSDSAALDNVLELLVRAGRSLPHALMMLIPEAMDPDGGREDLADEVRGFYRYHACLSEPWDGPACVTFTDGRVAGATLDRNGLRPGRWVVTTDGWVLLASEAGTLDLDPASIARSGRLRPGRLFVVDLDRHVVLADGEVEAEVAAARPYGRWFDREVVRLSDLPPSLPPGDVLASPDGLADPVRTGQLAFGWTREDLRVLVAPLAADGKEPDGSMGTDTPLAVLSDQAPALFSYFTQRFAQVTNPAIDPVREAVVMSLQALLGPEGDLLAENSGHARRLLLDQPVLRDGDLATIRNAERHLRGSSAQRLRTETIDCTWPADDGPDRLEAALARVCADVDAAISCGTAIVVLSDRRTSAARVPIPSLLAVGAVHHHLVRRGCRLRVGLVVESGEPRAVHHLACLLGYGANAVNPYLLFASLPGLVVSGDLPADTDLRVATQRVVAALGKGLRKVIAKMGISTLASYTGAQVFEALGLDRDLVDAHFTGTWSRIGGVGLPELAADALERHARAFPASSHRLLPTGGVYAWRRDGERHAWNPTTVPLLQEAVRDGDDVAYARFAAAVDEDANRRGTLRGLLRLVEADEPVPLEEVEPATAIVQRFATGAMSLGSISREVHETLATAMNRLGAKSNTGEGGEDPARFVDERRSAIKQVASARFGVTIDYLVAADQLQIKVAQGSKPGEGGQLPGHKVTEEIATRRHSTPGVELISPPPHHDIYSIEDLKQLIYDLRCANPEASVSVKLVAEAGVGTVAAGVAKAGADHVTISGHDGGTGSSPLSSISSAGIPWELGIAETQQTLVHHGLRSRIAVQADGGLRTGRDVVVAGLLGAEEMGFSTAPLVAVGCVMMRVCHLNTCPVGIATQDPALRARFSGTPEHVVTYFLHVAEDVRAHMARLGVRRFDDLVGRVDLLAVDEDAIARGGGRLDLSALVAAPDAPADHPRHRTEHPTPVSDATLDHDLVAACAEAIETGAPITLERDVSNTDLTVGGLLSSRITKARGAQGLPAGTVRVTLRGSAGQSFAAWLAPGVELSLVGEANDYVGKGLSGGVVSVRPHETAGFLAEDNVVVGNTVLYGATSGRAFFRGQAGQRFAVRNSGADAVVEGVGDHCGEYMTGGRVVVLGPTGRNVAAGMSGGILYVHDPDGRLRARCNHDLVTLDALDDADWAEVAALLDEHAERTGSPVARRLLDRPRWARRAFTKVIPTAFREALARGDGAAASEAVAAGLQDAPAAVGG